MEKFKGIIALDIDGTITVEKHTLEESVKDYLNYLITQGWKLIFITGRTFSFAKPLLSSLQGEYFFAVQNGAALYDMPREYCVKKHYVPTALLKKLDPLFGEHSGGLLVESGKENEDICFYKPLDFTSAELEYIDFRIRISPERWEAVASFDEIELKEFAVGKFFATESQAHVLAEEIKKIAPFSVIVIRDPFRPGWFLALVNEQQASKGNILGDFIAMHPQGYPVIGAGDDYNDVEMLKKSSFKIVMKNAPAKMHFMGDMIAPPAEEQGIIQGLEKAIWKVSSK